MKYPELSYIEIINALKRMDFIVVRQKGSHIRLQKSFLGKRINVTVPAQKPVYPYTLKLILSQAEISLEDFLKYL